MQIGFMAASFIGLLGAAALSDLWRFLIPNTVSIALVILFPVALLSGPHAGQWLSYFGGGLLVFIVSAVAFHFRLFGGGDVKLLAATALWMGFPLLPAFLLLVALAGGALAIGLLVIRVVLDRMVAPALSARRIVLPRLFVPGEKIPYGMAIGAAGIFLAPRIPLLAG